MDPCELNKTTPTKAPMSSSISRIKSVEGKDLSEFVRPNYLFKRVHEAQALGVLAGRLREIKLENG
ncbi:GL19510 [Drosophila persimilis]|uniref:GL19510 n=1 Tax=Drosophila persimilis TaxID=7234 RepID=B4G9M9_DROPE|nr:GL19510 [Drosophila persimilis]